MTTKWLREAESNIVDSIMWGESFHGVDICTVLDGEPVDDLLRYLVNRKTDEAMDWLERRVIDYVSRNEELVELYRMDEEERMRDSAIDAEIDRRYLVAEAI